MPRERTLARRERGELEQIEPWNTFRDMERMMREFFTSPLPLLRPYMRGLETGFEPLVDLKETEKEYVLSATIPGLDKDDIEIDVTEDTITLSGERKVEEEHPGERYHVRQQGYGAFRVTYTLPSEVKSPDVKATYKHGILEVVLPKAEVREAHKVKVDVEGK